MYVIVVLYTLGFLSLGITPTVVVAIGKAHGSSTKLAKCSAYSAYANILLF